jgi:hypothetical protein
MRWRLPQLRTAQLTITPGQSPKRTVKVENMDLLVPTVDDARPNVMEVYRAAAGVLLWRGLCLQQVCGVLDAIESRRTNS